MAKSVLREGWVYFLQAGESGPIKIGISRSAVERMRVIQSGHYEQIYLRCAFPCGGRSSSLERKLHQLFEAYHLRGEWFSPHPEIFALIDLILADEAQEIMGRTIGPAIRSKAANPMFVEAAPQSEITRLTERNPS